MTSSRENRSVRGHVLVLLMFLLAACSEDCSCGNQYGAQIGQNGQRDGLMVGFTTDTSAIVWARPREPSLLYVRYGRTPDLSDPSITSPQWALPEHDLTVHVSLAPLLPDTRYYYRVESLDHPGSSALRGTNVEAFRTAPAGSSDFRLAFGSCVCPGLPQLIWSQIIASDPSLFLMIGDHHYADSTDLDALRAGYRSARAIEGFAALAGRVPVLGQWDDHDFCGDDSDGRHPRKENALRAFGEYWANPSYGSDAAAGTWYSFAWAGVDFFVLDLRYWRNVGTPSMLGEVQDAWLREKLLASRAPFKVIVSPSVMNDGGSGDSWVVHHAAERDALLDFIEEQRIAGVLVLSGDRHRAEAWQLRSGDGGRYPIYEFVASSLANSASPCPPQAPAGPLFCADTGTFFGWMMFAMGRNPPMVAYETRDSEGRTVFRQELTAQQLSPGPLSVEPR